MPKTKKDSEQELFSMKQDAQLAAITARSSKATSQEKDDSINASTRYEAAKRQYDKDQPSKTDKDKTPTGKVPSYKKGGKVRATGVALLHKGERVMPKGKKKSNQRKGTARKK